MSATHRTMFVPVDRRTGWIATPCMRLKAHEARRAIAEIILGPGHTHEGWGEAKRLGYRIQRVRVSIEIDGAAS